MKVLLCIICYPGIEHCTMNVHLLSHLAFYVRQYGPLWTHSAFVFEDGIGHLVRKAHGTHDIGHQVIQPIHGDNQVTYIVIYTIDITLLAV